MNKVVSIQKDKQSLINDVVELSSQNKIRNLIIIIEQTDGEIKTGFNTDSVFEELGLLEIAKIDALKNRNLI
jgi:hypothetical protein